MECDELKELREGMLQRLTALLQDRNRDEREEQRWRWCVAIDLDRGAIIQSNLELFFRPHKRVQSLIPLSFEPVRIGTPLYCGLEREVESYSSKRELLVYVKHACFSRLLAMIGAAPAPVDMINL